MDKSVELFYKPPKDKYFEELKSLCIRFWEVFPEDTFYDNKRLKLEKEYANEKIEQIRNLKNESCNFVSMVQMIHQNYRYILSNLLSLETRNEISMRLYEREEENEFDTFNIWKIKK